MKKWLRLLARPILLSALWNRLEAFKEEKMIHELQDKKARKIQRAYKRWRRKRGKTMEARNVLNIKK